jgi:ribosome-binding factor A
MRSRKISRQELRSYCLHPEPDDGVDPCRDHRGETSTVANRKARQLCGQVAETVSGVLAESGDDILRDLLVESVLPAPNAGRLLVTVRSVLSVDVSQALERLERSRGRLRREVAAAINRRRTPDLIFRLVCLKV